MDEKTTDEVIGLFANLDIELTDHEISITHRLPSSNQQLPKPIIVKFTSRTAREKVFSSRHKFHSTKIDYKNCAIQSLMRIYINENLATYRKDLFKKAKNAAKMARSLLFGPIIVKYWQGKTLLLQS